MKSVAILSAIFVAALVSSPASAKMMSCTSKNMAKSMTAGATMQDGPQKMAMMREMGMANAAMSKGDMRGACKSYMRAQQAGMMKGGM